MARYKEPKAAAKESGDALLERQLEKVAASLVSESKGIKIDVFPLDPSVGKGKVAVTVTMPKAERMEAVKDLAAKTLNVLGDLSIGTGLIKDPETYRTERRQDQSNVWNYEIGGKRILYPDPPIYLATLSNAGSSGKDGALDGDTAEIRKYCMVTLFMHMAHELMHASLEQQGRIPSSTEGASRVSGAFTEGIASHISNELAERVLKKLGLDWISSDDWRDVHRQVLREAKELALPAAAPPRAGKLAMLGGIEPSFSAAYVAGSVLPSISPDYSMQFRYKYHNGEFMCMAVHLGAGEDMVKSTRLLMGAGDLPDLAKLAAGGMLAASSSAPAAHLRSSAEQRDAFGREAVSEFVSSATATVKKINSSGETVDAQLNFIEAVNSLGSKEHKQALIDAVEAMLSADGYMGGPWYNLIYEMRKQSALPQKYQIYYD